MISGSYFCKIGHTLCVNPGQSTSQLHAVTFELPNIIFTTKTYYFREQKMNLKGKAASVLPLKIF